MVRADAILTNWYALSAAATVMVMMASPAQAAGLTVRVVDASGRAINDAVVTLRPNAQAAPKARPGAGYRVEQRDIKFKPFVSVFPVNASVAFPNLDPVKHHVYSFSPTKRFELKLFARAEQRSITFDKPGIVAIGCNIHDSMTAYIYVTDTVWTQRSGANGAVSFGDTPGSAFTLSVWHPYLRAPGNVSSVVLQASAQDRTQTVTVRLRPPPATLGGY